MAAVGPPTPALLLVGTITGLPAAHQRAKEGLVSRFGELGRESGPWPFDATRYYEREMGGGLERRFLTFTSLIDPGQLSAIKLYTNELEQQIAREFPDPGRPRPVNLDPGYLLKDRLVLASAKDHHHRIYLGGGIYAEITLYSHRGIWEAHQMTFPDFRDTRYHAFLSLARSDYLQKLAAARRKPE